RRLDAAADLEVRVGRERQEVRERALDDAQAVLRQPQVAYHLRLQQAHRVGRHGVAETRVKLGGRDGAAHFGAALEHPHLQSGPGQVTGAYQPVVPAADDY